MANVAWVWECFVGMFLKVFSRVSRGWVDVIKSPFAHVRGFGKGKAKCEDAGEGNKCAVGRKGAHTGTGRRRPWRGNEGKAGTTN